MVALPYRGRNDSCSVWAASISGAWQVLPSDPNVVLEAPVTVTLKWAFQTGWTHRNCFFEAACCTKIDTRMTKCLQWKASYEKNIRSAFNHLFRFKKHVPFECHCIFACKNNGFAISTPAEQQYRGDGVCGAALGHISVCRTKDSLGFLHCHHDLLPARKECRDRALMYCSLKSLVSLESVCQVLSMTI